MGERFISEQGNYSVTSLYTVISTLETEAKYFHQFEVSLCASIMKAATVLGLQETTGPLGVTYTAKTHSQGRVPQHMYLGGTFWNLVWQRGLSPVSRGVSLLNM